MNIVYVYTNRHRSLSLNSDIYRIVCQYAIKKQHNLEIIDLYKDKFDPVLYEALSPSQTIHIKDYQTKIKKADMILFSYPMYWFGEPAILKGFFDCVWNSNFAYIPGTNIFENGLLQGKNVRVIVTCGSGLDRFCNKGVYGPFDNFVLDFKKIINYAGIFDIKFLPIFDIKTVKNNNITYNKLLLNVKNFLEKEF